MPPSFSIPILFRTPSGARKVLRFPYKGLRRHFTPSHFLGITQRRPSPACLWGTRRRLSRPDEPLTNGWHSLCCILIIESSLRNSSLVSIVETSPAGVGWDKAAVAAAGPPGTAPGGPALAYASLSHPTFPQQKLISFCCRKQESRYATPAGSQVGRELAP